MVSRRNCFRREAAILASSIIVVLVEVQNSDERGEALRGSKSSSVAGIVKGCDSLVFVAAEEARGSGGSLVWRNDGGGGGVNEASLILRLRGSVGGRADDVEAGSLGMSWDADASASSKGMTCALPAKAANSGQYVLARDMKEV